MVLRRTLVMSFLLLSAVPAAAGAQTRIAAFGGMGYTAVSKDAWTGHSSLADWNQALYLGNAQVLFGLPGGKLSVGAEGGYDYFFWFMNTAANGGVTYDVTAYHVMGVLNAQVGNNFVEVAAGPHMFDGFTDVGVYGAVGHRFRLGPSLTMPIKLRAGAVLDSDAALKTIGGLVGLEYTLPTHKGAALQH